MVVEHERHHFPVLKFPDFAVDFGPPDLFVERVQELLTRRSSGECSAVMLSAAEASKVEQTLGRTRKGNTHAVEQVNDRRRHFAHLFDGRLIGEKVTAVNSVVKMFPRRIALAFSVDRAVDA